MMTGKRTLENLNFDNSYARLPEHWFQRIEPVPLQRAHLISFNPRVAALLDLDPCSTHPDALARYFGGAQRLPGSEPLAMKYTGHQFGQYNPHLGDGRGVLLGEVVNQRGERWDLHLKGAGQTAYSRFGDGRAVLRSSIREYLVSEAMYGLGIPSTSALCLIGSEELTQRQGMELCATLLRVTPCHIRFGHFEHFYYQRRYDELQQLADYALERFYPECRQAPQPYLAMFEQVVTRSARLVALWQSYGFVHGVLNTDNMSLAGESFDYGPFTFMDQYDPDHVANKNDDEGRYAFARQPDVVLWNLACLAQALLPLIEREALEQALEGFEGQFRHFELQRKRARLGLQRELPGDATLVDALWQFFARQHVDIHRFFSHLTDAAPACDAQALQPWSELEQGWLRGWLENYRLRLGQEAASAPLLRQQMRALNPRYVLRNYMAEEAIGDATQGDYRRVNRLLALLRHPGEYRQQEQRYAEQPPDWAGQIRLTCSS